MHCSILRSPGSLMWLPMMRSPVMGHIMCINNVLVTVHNICIMYVDYRIRTLCPPLFTDNSAMFKITDGMLLTADRHACTRK